VGGSSKNAAENSVHLLKMLVKIKQGIKLIMV
jgi:hypothetical protein